MYHGCRTAPYRTVPCRSVPCRAAAVPRCAVSHAAILQVGGGTRWEFAPLALVPELEVGRLGRQAALLALALA